VYVKQCKICGAKFEGNLEDDNVCKGCKQSDHIGTFLVIALLFMATKLLVDLLTGGKM